MENFVNIVRASAIQTQDSAQEKVKTVPSELMEVLAGRLVDSGADLQGLLAQIKAAAACGDGLALRRANAQMAERYKTYSTGAAEQIIASKGEIALLEAALQARDGMVGAALQPGTAAATAAVVSCGGGGSTAAQEQGEGGAAAAGASTDGAGRVTGLEQQAAQPALPQAVVQPSAPPASMEQQRQLQGQQQDQAPGASGDAMQS